MRNLKTATGPVGFDVAQARESAFLNNLKLLEGPLAEAIKHPDVLHAVRYSDVPLDLDYMRVVGSEPTDPNLKLISFNVHTTPRTGSAEELAEAKAILNHIVERASYRDSSGDRTLVEVRTTAVGSWQGLTFASDLISLPELPHNESPHRLHSSVNASMASALLTANGLAHDLGQQLATRHVFIVGDPGDSTDLNSSKQLMTALANAGDHRFIGIATTYAGLVALRELGISDIDIGHFFKPGDFEINLRTVLPWLRERLEG